MRGTREDRHYRSLALALAQVSGQRESGTAIVPSSLIYDDADGTGILTEIDQGTIKIAIDGHAWPRKSAYMNADTAEAIGQRLIQLAREARAYTGE